MTASPASEAGLLARAHALGGRTVIELAEAMSVPLPASPSRAKGFVGQLVERALGGACDTRAAPDFPELGVELKTLPVDRQGRVRESTFVCTAPIEGAEDADWAQSRVHKKLRRVLFVVMEADRDIKPGRRRLGAAWIWSPSPSQAQLLRTDWEEIMGRIGAGEVESIDARMGTVLQLRPKGANAAARTVAFDGEGAPFLAPKRAFYLRATFTHSLLQDAMAPVY
ncbi:MAG: DNA mismatch repair endonuclease MutH [Sandaracinaceae bacterium]